MLASMALLRWYKMNLQSFYNTSVSARLFFLRILNKASSLAWENGAGRFWKSVTVSEDVLTVSREKLTFRS